MKLTAAIIKDTENDVFTAFLISHKGGALINGVDIDVVKHKFKRAMNLSIQLQKFFRFVKTGKMSKDPYEIEFKEYEL